MHMRSSILFFALLLFGFASCTKNYNDDDLLNPSYHIDGITDLSIVKGSSIGASLSLNVVYENSEQERVRLSFENVPAGLSTKIFTPSGIPTFSSFITLADSGVAEGSYTIQLVATGNNTGRKTFPINVEVSGAPDCTDELVNNGSASYTASSSCTGTSFTADILSTSTRNRVLFTNYNNTGISLFADIDCSSQTMNFPSQVVNGVNYSGSGSYEIFGAQRSVRFAIQSFTAGGGANFCSIFFQK